MNTEQKTKTIQKALDILTPIPRKDWIISKYTNGVNKCCAVGHFNRLVNNESDYSYSNCFHSELEMDLRRATSNVDGDDISHVNNFEVGKYKQKTPKGRVIRFLKDLLKSG